MPAWNADTSAWEPDAKEIDHHREHELMLRAIDGRPEAPRSPKAPSSTLFWVELADREFSSHLFRVADLLEWASEKRLTIDTLPPLGGFDFVQAEGLLSAIQEKVQASVTPTQALELVSMSPELARHRVANEPQSCCWLLGAEAHRKWRLLLKQAIEGGELRLLEFSSKLPIEQPSDVPRTSVQSLAGLATPDDLIAAFGPATGMNGNWFRNLKDRPGLKVAREVQGARGRNGHQPLFDTMKVLAYLTGQRRGVTPLSQRRAWDLLKQHFPRVYAANEIGDPNGSD